MLIFSWSYLRSANWGSCYWVQGFRIRTLDRRFFDVLCCLWLLFSRQAPLLCVLVPASLRFHCDGHGKCGHVPSFLGLEFHGYNGQWLELDYVSGGSALDYLMLLSGTPYLVAVVEPWTKLSHCLGTGGMRNCFVQYSNLCCCCNCNRFLIG